MKLTKMVIYLLCSAESQIIDEIFPYLLKLANKMLDVKPTLNPKLPNPETLTKHLIPPNLHT
jgi:hypothetical protein